MTEVQAQTSTPISPEIVHTPKQVLKEIIEGNLPPPTPGNGKAGFEALRIRKAGESKITEEDTKKPKMIKDGKLKERAEQVLKNLRLTDLYLQALERIEREGLTKLSADKEKVFKELTGETRSVSVIEKQVVDFLSSQPAIRALFPKKRDNQVRKALSELIANQPQFREILVRMTKDALAGFESLPKVGGEGEELENKRRELIELKALNDALLNDLSKRLGISLDELKNIIKYNNEDLNLILREILEKKTESLEKEFLSSFEDQNIFSNVLQLIEYGGSSALNNVRLSIAEISKQIEDAESTLKTNYQEQAQKLQQAHPLNSSLTDQNKQLNQQVASLKQQLSSLTLREKLFKTTLSTIIEKSPTLLQKIDDLVKLNQLVSMKHDDLINQSVIAGRINNYLLNITKIGSLEKEVEKLENQFKEKKSELVAREVAERDLVEELEAVANNSFVEFLEEKAREMAKKDEEKRNKESDEALKRFDEALSKRYIEFNSDLRKYIHHRQITGADMRLLASGDEGGKIIVARILFNNNTLTSLATLTPEQLSQVEKIYQQKGADLRKRLMTDYFRQRTFFDRIFKFGKWFSKEVLFEGGFGALTLTDAEWEQIGRHFGSEIDAALAASKQGQEILRQLKEKGININWNLKWLLYILLALGALGTIFVVRSFSGA